MWVVKGVQRFPRKLKGFVSQVFIEQHLPVDKAVRRDFDDAISQGLDKLVVLRRKKQCSGKILQAFVERRDRFHIQVVGGFIHHQYIRAGEHHPREHAADLFAAGKHAHALKRLVPGK